MKTKLISSTDQSYTTVEDLPSEVLCMTFANLNLIDLLEVQLVCKTWSETLNADNTIWKEIASQKAIILNPSIRIRAQVFDTFGNYCQAARMLFPEQFADCPIDLNSAYERAFFDKKLAELDQSNINPINSISKYLERPECQFGLLEEQNPLVKTPLLIPRIGEMTSSCIAMLQVAVETGTPLIFDEDFLECLENSDFSYGSNQIIVFFEKNHTHKEIFKSNSSKTMDGVLDYIKNMDTLNEAAMPFIHYLFQLKTKPSFDLIFPFLKSCAYSEIIKALAPMKVRLYEKKNIHEPLLKNLSGSDWVKSFEEFMLKEGFDPELKIQYPKQLQELIKAFDDQTRDECIEFMTLEISPFRCNREFYIQQQINKSLEQSIRRL